MEQGCLNKTVDTMTHRILHLEGRIYIQIEYVWAELWNDKCSV